MIIGKTPRAASALRELYGGYGRVEAASACNDRPDDCCALVGHWARESLLRYNMLMDKVKTQLRRLSYFTKRDFLTVHNIATAAAVILGLVFTYNAVTATTRNWQLEQKLKERSLESAKLQIEVDTLTLEKQYYNTVSY